MSRAIVDEFPEFIELSALLKLAAVTWPRFGLSAAQLAEMDLWALELLRVAIGE